MALGMKLGRISPRAVAWLGGGAMAAQGALWFLGLGSRDAHWILAPVWIGALLWLARSGGEDALGNRPANAGGDSRWPARALVLVFGLAWIAALLRMYCSFRFSAFDLGIYSSIAFNTAHGHPFFSSPQQMNHLGEHFSPIMAVFAPLYRLAPTPLWLLGAGLAAYLAAPLCLLRVARRLGVESAGGRWTAFGLALLWFLNAPMARAVEFLFHPSTLAAPFVVLAWAAAAERRWGRLAAWLAFLLLFKESLALAAAGIGLWLLARRDTRGAGAVVLGLGLAAGVALAGWFIPFMRGGAWTHVERLAPLKDLLPKAGYMARLLLPFGFLHARGRALLPALPLILLNVSTGFAPQYGMGHHYDDIVVPLLFAGALGGWAEGARPVYFGWRRPLAVAAAALCVLLPLGPSPLRLAAAHRPTAEQAAARRSLRVLAEQPELGHSMLYVQDHLDPFLPRLEKTVLERLDPGHPPAGAWAVLSPNAPAWPDASFAEALRRGRGIPGVAEAPGFPGLRVFRIP